MSDLSYDTLIFIGTITAAVVLTMAFYLIARFAVVHFFKDHTQDLSASVTFRVGALHALIIALVFAQEIQNNREIRGQLVAEATAISDLFYDLGRYGGSETQKMRVTVARYARQVVEGDWPALRKHRRNAEGSYVHWEAIYQHVLDLVPQNPRHEALRAHMLDRIHRIIDVRQARKNAATQSISVLFWLAAASGLFFVWVPFCVYPPRPLNLLLIVTFAAYAGLVLFIIYAFSDPFSPPGALLPTSYQSLLDGEIGQWVDGQPK